MQRDFRLLARAVPPDYPRHAAALGGLRWMSPEVLRTSPIRLRSSDSKRASSDPSIAAAPRPHPSQILLTETAPMAGLQLSPRCCDNLCAVFGAPALEDLGENAIPGFPSCQYSVVSAAFAATATWRRGDSIICPRSRTSVETWSSSSDADGSRNTLEGRSTPSWVVGVVIVLDSFFVPIFAGSLVFVMWR